MKDWCRSEEIGYLAQIWKSQGGAEEAHNLLIDALRGLLEQSRTATGSDCKLFEGWFQTRRSTYLQLFSDRGDDDLRRHGVPSGARYSIQAFRAWGLPTERWELVEDFDWN